MKSPITTHILDLVNGHPASGVTVVLEIQDDSGSWIELTRDETNDDGRITEWLTPGEPARTGTYRLTFKVGDYFGQNSGPVFYNEIPVVFELSDPSSHHHIPLLLSPYGYSTYRGS